VAAITAAAIGVAQVAQAMEVPMAVVQGRVALVAGATGLVGREILAALLADKSYSTVHCVGRRALALKHPKLVGHVVDFGALPLLPKVDDCFIALGTTIKVAGSKSAFRAVDLDAVVALARATIARGATKLGVVSAMGADAKSLVFYNRTKGEMEDTLAQLGFHSLVIARPSMLAGAREALNQPTRSGEQIALTISKMFKPLIPANYRSIAAQDVAHALVNAVKSGQPGVQRLLSGAMQRS
jgi:uncharacterized protein YbjT (DUF2867 family)